MWLIETASAIDLTDPRWLCFGLYEVSRAAGAGAGADAAGGYTG